MIEQDIFEGLDMSILDKMNIPAIEQQAPPAQEKATEDTKLPKNVIREEDLIAPDFKEVNSIADFTGGTVETPAPVVEESVPTEPEVVTPTESLNKVWSEWASEKGLIENFKPEEFEDSEEFIIRKFEEKVENTFNSWIEKLPPTLTELIKNYREGVPLDRLIDIESRITEYSGIKAEDLEKNEDLQKMLVADFLGKDDLFSDEEIEAQIQEYQDTALLFKQAQKVLPKLIQLEKAAKQNEIKQAQDAQKSAENRYNEWATSLKNKISSVEEVIPGYKLDDNSRKKIFDSLTKVVGRDKEGRPINAIAKHRIDDPNYDIKVAFISEILGFDLSSAERKAMTRTTQQVRQTSTPAVVDSKLGKVDIATIKRFLNRK